jgi:hypothetical protein
VTVRLALVLLTLPLAASRARAPDAVAVAADAATEMRALWSASVAAHTELVACLASTVDGDTLRITRIQPLFAGADSLAVSAESSLETCGPPMWQGTAHTHIALTANQHPYALFSGADRGIMLMWWQRWKSDGTFCLLYAQDRAHCEIDGSRVLIFPTTSY